MSKAVFPQPNLTCFAFQNPTKQQIPTICGKNSGQHSKFVHNDESKSKKEQIGGVNSSGDWIPFGLLYKFLGTLILAQTAFLWTTFGQHDEVTEVAQIIIILGNCWSILGVFYSNIWSHCLPCLVLPNT